jgi:hypothetical protein
LNFEKTFNYLYKTTSKIDGKIYIGVRSCNIEIQKDDYLGSGLLLRKAISKYGREAFNKEILYVFPTRNEAFLKEREIVDEEFVERNDTFNLSIGGNGGLGPSLCKTKESHILTIQKTALKRKGTKCTKQSLIMKGRTKENNLGIKRMSEYKKTLPPEKHPSSKMTKLERDNLFYLYKLGKSWNELQQCLPQMTIAGIKSAIYKMKGNAVNN